MPGSESSNLRAYKFPFVASKILSLDFPDILDTINESKENISLLTSFLNQPSPINTTLTSYFTILCESLLSRDNSLLKAINAKDADILLKHLNNRGFNELFIKVIEKSIKSKKSYERGQKLIEHIIKSIINIEICRNAQIILSSVISEDEVYNEFKNLLQGLILAIKSSEDIVRISALKIVRSMLEKEKDLKQIDDEGWGGVQCVECIQGILESLCEELRRKDRAEISMSMGISIRPAGEAVLLIIEIMGLIVEMNKPEIFGLLHDYQILGLLIDTFQSYPWNSFLHYTFTCFVESVMQSSLISEFSLMMQEIIVKYCLDPELKMNSCLGLVAYCWKIGDMLVEHSEARNELREKLEAHFDWKEFMQRLRQKNTIEMDRTNS